MPFPAFSKTLFLKILQRLAAFTLLLLLSTTALHAAQEALLRLDPGGHTAKVGNLLITLDGKLVTASDDKTIRIWNPKNGREERKILGQLGPGILRGNDLRNRPQSGRKAAGEWRLFYA